jgi:hypothetical protein
MEDRMLTQARGDGAPRLTRADAARALGVNPERLEHALAGLAHDANDACTETGLRGDQAAAALSALTDGKRVSVINARPDRARRGFYSSWHGPGNRRGLAR